MINQSVDVCIIGSGPSGLMLSRLLAIKGLSSIILERSTRSHVEKRIRAGVLEHGAAQTIIDSGMGERLKAERMLHDGVCFVIDGKQARIDLTAYAEGQQISVYGQHEVVRDMIAYTLENGVEIVFEAGDVALHDFEAGVSPSAGPNAGPSASPNASPSVTYQKDGREYTVNCKYIAGCDGFHGVSRKSMPEDKIKEFHRSFPFAWLGIMAKAEPASDELIYARHRNGFALYSMRSQTLSRLYLQVPLETDIADWPDDKIWDELDLRLGADAGWSVNRGEIIDKSITPLRSFVVEPMQLGKLFLAGDAAHIVPPTGAKGMNLAIADVRVLAVGLAKMLNDNDGSMLNEYSQICLRRVWRAQRFSWWMTGILHSPEGAQDTFQSRIDQADLEHLLSSDCYAKIFAENYVGLPFEV